MLLEPGMYCIVKTDVELVSMLIALGVDSTFVSTIVLFNNQLFPSIFAGFLKRSKDPWKELGR